MFINSQTRLSSIAIKISIIKQKYEYIYKYRPTLSFRLRTGLFIF